jgi:acetyltransferase-like isoleucine patch superfamily enzyme
MVKRKQRAGTTADMDAQEGQVSMASRERNYRIRYGIVKFISVMPANFLRVSLYRLLLKYRIGKNVKIGYGTTIQSDNVDIADRVKIKSHNKFFRMEKVTIGEGTVIAGYNNFHGASFSLRHPRKNSIELGKNCHITAENLFDGASGIIFGDEVKIGGRGTDFWSHGSTKENDTIVVGMGTRFGPACKIGTAVEIGENCLIGMGTIITKSFPEEKCLIAGVPAKIIRRDYDWHDHWW